MADVPRQDWELYRTLTAESDAAWLRGLTTNERFALYADLFEMIWSARRGPGDWERLDQWRWEQKVETRLRMVDAFRKLDELRRARNAAESPG